MNSSFSQVDRLFEWKRGPASQIDDTVKKQKKNTKTEFEGRVQQVIGEFAEQVKIIWISNSQQHSKMLLF